MRKTAVPPENFGEKKALRRKHPVQGFKQILKKCYFNSTLALFFFVFPE
jgi:hypothetical protein